MHDDSSYDEQYLFCANQKDSSQHRMMKIGEKSPVFFNKILLHEGQIYAFFDPEKLPKDTPKSILNAIRFDIPHLGMLELQPDEINKKKI